MVGQRMLRVARQAQLLNARFFVLNVATNNWVKFTQIELFGAVLLIFRRRVVVTSAGRRDQLNFFANLFSHNNQQ